MPWAGAVQSQMTMQGCVRASERRGPSSPARNAGENPQRATISPTIVAKSALSDATKIVPRSVSGASSPASCLRRFLEVADRGGARESGARRRRQKTREGAVLRPLASVPRVAVGESRRYRSKGADTRTQRAVNRANPAMAPMSVSITDRRADPSSGDTSRVRSDRGRRRRP